MFEEYALVKASKDLSQLVKKGTVGTIVMIYRWPQLGYEVEFFDDANQTIDVLTVEVGDIEKR